MLVALGRRVGELVVAAGRAFLAAGLRLRGRPALVVAREVVRVDLVVRLGGVAERAVALRAQANRNASAEFTCPWTNAMTM